jgi:hypothetical protein
VTDVEQPEGGHLFSITEAAQATGMHRDTIKRRVGKDEFPNARRDSAGAWLIPLGDLLAAGLTVNAPASGEDTAQHQEPAPPAAQVALLEAERDRWRAEAFAIREALDIAKGRYESAEQQLRALMPAQPAQPAPVVVRTPPTAGQKDDGTIRWTTTPPKKHWWNRSS